MCGGVWRRVVGCGGGVVGCGGGEGVDVMPLPLPFSLTLIF